MDATDLLLVSMRWLHSLAAVAWIGSIIHELLVGPAHAAAPPEDAAGGAVAKEIVETSLVVFLITGLAALAAPVPRQPPATSRRPRRT